METKVRSSRLPGALLWIGCGLLLIWALVSSPSWYQLQQIVISPDIGSSVKLGRPDLLASDADKEHLLVTHSARTEWRFKNLSTEKKLLLIDAKGVERRAREWPLVTGAAFRIRDAVFEVAKADAGQLHLIQWFADREQHWFYDGSALRRGDVDLPLCPDAGVRQRLERSWNKIEFSHPKISLPLYLGGGVYCGTSLGIAGVPPDSLEIVSREGDYFLRIGNGANVGLGPVWLSHEGIGPLLGEMKVIAKNPGVEQLHKQTLAPNEGDRLIVGHSHYKISLEDEALVLLPLYRTERVLAPSLSEQDDVQQIWSKNSLWSPSRPMPYQLALGWFGLLFVICSIWLIRPASVMHHRASRTQRLFMVTAVFLGGLSFLGYYNADVIPISWVLLVAWGGVLAWVLVPWGLTTRPVVFLMQLLLCLGLVVQLHLGLGAVESHWLSYAAKSGGVIGASLWSAWAVYRYLSLGGVEPAITGISGRAIIALFVVAISAMMLQVALGSESGVAGVQPVEFAKLALLAGSAYALAYLRRWESWNLEIHPWRLWAVMLMPIVLMLGLITLALFLLRDFSPLVLILFWAFAVAWAYQYSLPDRKKRWLGLGSLSLLVIAAMALILMLKQHPDWLDFLAQSDRILTWAEPHLHPHSGDQVSQAIRVLRDGERFGQWLNGVPYTVGVNPDPVMSVPAIQDDFILAFALNRMGIAGGLAILLLQLMLVGALIAIAHNLTRTHVIQGQGDYHRITLGWFGYFFLYGGAGFLLGHIVVSWGTNSGLLPVMGQPSPFISAAGSHLVFFIFPLLITSVVIDHPSKSDR